MIILDDYFKELFNIYYKGTTLQGIKDYLETLALHPNIIIDVVNLLKVSSGMNYTFANIYEEILRLHTNELPVDGDDEYKFILGVTSIYFVDTGNKEIDKFFKKERDFVAEVVAQKFNLPIGFVTDAKKDELLNNSDDIYSITDPPVDNWDEYFFNVCRQAARHSKCLSRRIGAVLVKDKSIVSTGYNSPPRGVPRCDERWTLDANFITKYKDKIVNPLDTTKPMCPRYSLGAKSGEMLDICIAGHAEENAILNAAWHGIATKDTTLFLNCGIPCFRCLIKIINAGISEIVVTGITFYDDNAEFLLNNSTVKVRLYNFK